MTHAATKKYRTSEKALEVPVRMLRGSRIK